MNYWSQKSVDLANESDYLDQLYNIYKIEDNERRTIETSTWNQLVKAYEKRDSQELVEHLLSLELFPIKDSYVATLKRDKSFIKRNPKTVERIAKRVFAMGLDKLEEKCTEPKETNRQMGPLFKMWIGKGALGLPVYTNEREFLKSKNDAILNVSDAEMKLFAKTYLGYNRDKGLDFIARINNKYVIGEAKFLTDFGGHQNAQFDDAISTINASLVTPNKLNSEVIKIGIMDGVLYIKTNNKLYNYLKNNSDYIIISALLLKDFIKSLKRRND